MKNITYYQMANRSDEEVKSQFVVRKNEYEQVISEIRHDHMEGSIQHYVFVGQRGSGKSTLLRRIQAEVNTDKKLANRLIAVNLSEEQAGIYRLHDLWDRVAQELENQGLTVPKVLWEDFGSNMTGYAKELYFALQAALKKANKKLVLLLDNIDRIFETIKQDQHLFRELLMNHKDVRIVGGSTRLSEHHWKYDAPFYEFFSIIRLESLTREELRELLLFWGEFFNEPSLKQFVEKHPGKLEAIRILSDGMPRTMLHLIELLIHEPEKHGYDYLQQIVDRATPIYQERLGTLSPSHQKILLELSFFWEAIKVKELVGAVKMESKTVSAMLKQLVDLQIVEKVSGEGRNHFYRLKERFFNLWLVMTQGGPRQKNQVRWLTIFLETWYDEEEFRIYFSHIKENLDSMTPDQAALVTKAVAHSKYITVEERDEMLDRVLKLMEGKKSYIDLLPKKSHEVYTEVISLLEANRSEEAISMLETIEQPDGLKFRLLGDLYSNIRDFKNAEINYLKAAERNERGVISELAELYQNNKKYSEAEKWFLRSIENGNKLDVYRLAVLFKERGDFLKAESYFKEAINLGVNDAYFDLGYLYEYRGESSLAEKFYLKAVETGESNASYNLALLYEEQGRNKEAVKYYQKAIVAGDLTVSFDLAELYIRLKRLDLAEKQFRNAIAAGYSKAFYDLLSLYYKSNEKRKSIMLMAEYPNIERMELRHRVEMYIYSIWLGDLEPKPDLDAISRELIERRLPRLSSFLVIQLLIHHQYNVVERLFDGLSGQTFRDFARPLYFAFLQLSIPGKGQSSLSIPPELKETVRKICQTVSNRQKIYYP